MPTVSSTSNSIVEFTGEEARALLLAAAVEAGGVMPDMGETQDSVSIRLVQAGITNGFVEIANAATVRVAAVDAEGAGTTPV